MLSTMVHVPIVTTREVIARWKHAIIKISGSTRKILKFNVFKRDIATPREESVNGVGWGW